MQLGNNKEKRRFENLVAANYVINSPLIVHVLSNGLINIPIVWGLVSFRLANISWRFLSFLLLLSWQCYHHIHKNQTPDPIVSHLNPFHILKDNS